MALSQEQINALLEGTGTFDPPAAPAGAGSAIPAAEESFFRQLATVAMEAGAVAISQALGKNVHIHQPQVSTPALAQLQQELNTSQVLIRTGYVLGGQELESILLVKDYDVAVIFDILMGKDGRNPDLEISDLQISAIGEVMNQLMGAAATALSKEYNTKVAMKPPASELLEAANTSAFPREFQGKPLMALKFNLMIEGILDSELYELRALDTAHSLMGLLTGKVSAPAPAPVAAPMAAASAVSASRPVVGGSSAPTAVQSGVSVRPAEFSPLSIGAAAPSDASLDMIMDIPLRVTVELGSSRLKIKDVLDLTKGSVVELNKLAGEPVDLLVNGKLMAKGEVVVISENFGLRITEILGQSDRINNLRL